MTEKAKTEQQYALALPAETIQALDYYAEMGQKGQFLTNFMKTMTVSTAIAEIKKILTPKAMEPIKALENTGIGFLTDRKAGGYDVDTVRDCIIEAVMQGVMPVGNEFNIIAGRCYVTKNGMAAKLRAIPGLKYTLTPMVPKKSGDQGAICTVQIDWTYNGEKNSKALDFAVKMNAGMGCDALIGKAKRKAMAWLFEMVTGQNIDEGEIGEDAPLVDVTPQKAELFVQAEAMQSSGAAMEEM